MYHRLRGYFSPLAVVFVYCLADVGSVEPLSAFLYETASQNETALTDSG